MYNLNNYKYFHFSYAYTTDGFLFVCLFFSLFCFVLFFGFFFISYTVRNFLSVNCNYYMIFLFVFIRPIEDYSISLINQTFTYNDRIPLQYITHPNISCTSTVIPCRQKPKIGTLDQGKYFSNFQIFHHIHTHFKQVKFSPLTFLYS